MAAKEGQAPSPRPFHTASGQAQRHARPPKSLGHRRRFDGSRLLIKGAGYTRGGQQRAAQRAPAAVAATLLCAPSQRPCLAETQSSCQRRVVHARPRQGRTCICACCLGQQPPVGGNNDGDAIRQRGVQQLVPHLPGACGHAGERVRTLYPARRTCSGPHSGYMLGALVSAPLRRAGGPLRPAASSAN